MTTLNVGSSWLAGALFQTLASPHLAWPGDNFLCGSAGWRLVAGLGHGALSLSHGNTQGMHTEKPGLPG